MKPSFHADTIVALATGAGRAAIGVVRVSGPATAGLLARFFRSPGTTRAPAFAARPRQALYCDLADPDGETLDSGLVTFFPGPASYTGEDVAEIALHGNPLLLRRCVEVLITAGLGARPADPGEFTRRAFLNGKLDLPQAEAVRRIIEAKSQFELRASQKLLAGELSRLVSRFRSTIISLKAETEAEVDFATEDLTFETKAERISRIVALEAEIAKIVERAAGTTRAASGFQIALMGVPNAGKSSLLNRMLGWDRAIVSDIPGTTRDYLAEEIELDGVTVRFVDTAGLRATTNQVEAEGVRRSESEIKRSRLVLHVIDGARPAYPLPPVPETASDPALLYVLNKKDALVPDAWAPGSGMDTVVISCATGDGLDLLREKIRGHLFASINLTDPLLLEERHRFHFLECRSALNRAHQLLTDNAPAEIVALEIDTALRHTGEVTGRITDEEILGRIFSMFCVGK